MTSAPNVTSPDPLTEVQRLTNEGHTLDVTVWLMIFSIFTFFFIIVVASICMHWMEVRRYGNRNEFIVLPPGPVPACLTVMYSNQPHLKIIDYYHLHPSYGAANSQFNRSSSFPLLPRQNDDVSQNRK